MRRVLFVFLGFGLSIISGCASGVSNLALVSPVGANGSIENVLVVTNRKPDADPTIRFNGDRGETLSFSSAGIWVPANRTAGEMRYPYSNINPDKHFATIAFEGIADKADLVRRINQKLRAIPDPSERRVILFVHGFNVDFGEGIYRMAQIKHDFGVEGAAVHFSWPSAGLLSRYLYDRDSANLSRDAFAETLELVAQSDATSIMIIAHSMGTFLSMESLRQLSIDDRGDVIDKINPLILASPDIDMDVFRAQLGRLDPPPRNIVTLVSKRDTILSISERLRGGQDRVGKGDQIRELQNLGVTVLDMTTLEDSATTHHNAFAESPTMLELIRSGSLKRLLDGADSHEERDTGVGTVTDIAATIIYLPARVLGDR